MFLAICYREASPTKLKEFQAEVENREEKMSEEMGEIFETLVRRRDTDNAIWIAGSTPSTINTPGCRIQTTDFWKAPA